jgi:hypothetical protein
MPQVLSFSLQIMNIGIQSLSLLAQVFQRLLLSVDDLIFFCKLFLKPLILSLLYQVVLIFAGLLPISSNLGLQVCLLSDKFFIKFVQLFDFHHQAVNFFLMQF